MPITAPKPKTGTGDFKVAPAGNHLAVCYGVLDLGTHDGEWQGKPKKNRRLMLQFELSDEAMDDGRPFSLSRTFNLSVHENAGLRKFINSWVGPLDDSAAADFDFETLAGRPCMLTVVHNTRGDRTYANVEGAAPLPKRIAPPEQINPTRIYSVEAGPPPADFPDWLKDTIADSDEMKARKGGGGRPVSSSAVPFDETAPQGCPFDTGKAFFGWLQETGQREEVDITKYIASWGKLMEYPGRIVDWDASMVATAYAEATRKLSAIAPMPAEPPFGN